MSLTDHDRTTVAVGHDHDHDRRAGAVSVRGAGHTVRKTPLGWLPWTALLLAGILGLGALLIARNVGDAGDDPGVDLTDNAAADGQDPPGPDANADDGGDAGGDPDTNGSSGSGSGTASGSAAPAAPATGVTAGGQALLPLPSGGLAPFRGQAVEGKAATVESVVADEGFWVGTDPNNRIFVFLTDEAKAAQGESPFQVKAGQRVDFAGTMQPVPQDLTPFGVDRSEGSEQLRQQGHYVELRSVALSG